MEKTDIIEQQARQLFEERKRTDKQGREFWLARDLQDVLGYSEWRQFSEDAIGRAKRSCSVLGWTVGNHFVETYKKVTIGSQAARDVKDIILSRFACYLIAMNGEPSKPEIAAAQAYFVVNTRNQELVPLLRQSPFCLRGRNICW